MKKIAFGFLAAFALFCLLGATVNTITRESVSSLPVTNTIYGTNFVLGIITNGVLRRVPILQVRGYRSDGTNTALGANTLSTVTEGSGIENTAFGSDALHYLTTGTENLAIGHRSSISNSSGGFNVSVGNYAMEYNQFRSDNTAIGYHSLRDFVTGYENTAVGSGAMELNTSSYDSTGVGYGALDRTDGIGNTAFGAFAMNNASGGGQYNVGIGYEALQNSDSLDGNVAIGTDCLLGIDNLTNVVAIGYGATATASGLTNAIVIGAKARVSANNQMVFGTNITDYVFNGLRILSNSVTLYGTTNQVVFGATNLPPSTPATPSKWISVQVSGESVVYRLPLNQ